MGDEHLDGLGWPLEAQAALSEGLRRSIASDLTKLNVCAELAHDALSALADAGYAVVAAPGDGAAKLEADLLMLAKAVEPSGNWAMIAPPTLLQMADELAAMRSGAPRLDLTRGEAEVVLGWFHDLNDLLPDPTDSPELVAKLRAFLAGAPREGDG